MKSHFLLIVIVIVSVFLFLGVRMTRRVIKITNGSHWLCFFLEELTNLLVQICNCGNNSN